MRTPARHLASTLAVRRIGDALRGAHDRYDMRCACAVAHGARDPIRFPVCFDVVTCRRCADRPGEIRLRRRHRVNRKGRAMRRRPERQKRDPSERVVARVAIERKCFMNVSVFGERNRNARCAVSRVDDASMAQCPRSEAGRPSAHARFRCDRSRTERRIENALQKCTFVPGASVADARSCVTRQGEYRCVRMHLVRPCATCRASRSAHVARRRRTDAEMESRIVRAASSADHARCDDRHARLPVRPA